MANRNKNSQFLIAVFFLGLFLFAGVLIGDVWLWHSKTVTSIDHPVVAENSTGGPNCRIYSEDRIVRGNSLEGLVPSGSSIHVLFNYYDCHSIQKDDVVAFRYGGSSDPLIKIVKGVPGDSFEFKGEQLLINNMPAKNYSGSPYRILLSDQKMLSLYMHDYRNIIPANSYLVLGNQINGTLDSIRLGLVDKSDILGKAEF